MADLSSVLVPSVAPAGLPDDYQHIQADPSSFGGEIAKGTEKAGAGIEQASAHLFDTSKFFGQVAADNASNGFQEFTTKLLHGDPDKQVQGPDGQMVQDTGYLGLRGRAALEARPQVSKAIDDQLETTRATLTSPEQQLEFDNFSRRYRAGVEEKVGTHADGQATTWYQSVNTASAKIALDHISINADNPQEYLAGESDLVHAYVKTAQLAGAQPGDPQFTEAVANARKDALKARLDVVAVKNPSQALSILDKPENKAIAGQYYDNMSSAYRGRAKQQQGFDVGSQTILSTYTDKPAPNPVTLTNAGAQYGIAGSYLMRVHQLEGNGVSETGAQGPFQFTAGTAKQYGLKDPFNYAQAADAAAHLAADNKVALTASLGRSPSDAELYLAHQQGAEGAAKLLANPNARAGDLVGDRAVRVNGGDPNMTAAAFSGMWTQKFNNAPLQATENRKAQAYQKIMAIPDSDIDPDVRQHALTYVNQQLSAQAIAEENDAKAKAAASAQEHSAIVSDIIMGKTEGVIGRIGASQILSGAEKETLYKFAVGDGGVSDPLQFGPAYSSALKRMLASPETPDRINGPQEIVAMGADGSLTKRGVKELIDTQNLLKKQPDQAGITTVKSHQLDYYKSKMAIDDEMSAVTGKPFKNQKGLDHFNHDFVPAFESAYGKWIGAGKDPMDFLTDSKQMDAIMDRVYPPAQRAADSVSAGAGTQKPDMTLPPVPEGLNKNTFETIVKHPPVGIDGTQWTPMAFSTAIDRLRTTPTPEMKAAFNKHFGKAGFDADEILKKLPAKPSKQADAGPLDKLVSDNAVVPGTQPAEVANANPLVVTSPVTIGIRG